MKKLIVIIMTLFSLTAGAETINAEINNWKKIDIEIPEGKIGGGDFYNVSVEPYDSGYEFVMKEDGIEILFTKKGMYHLVISVNHIVKTTCASVHIDPVSSRDVTFIIE